MLKYAMIAGAITAACPALAQTAPATPAAQPATGAQIAQAVDAQFPAYDTDSNGALTHSEFAKWMVALKAQTDPAIRADSYETLRWVGAAFARADTDRSSSLTKTELIGFLARVQQG